MFIVSIRKDIDPGSFEFPKPFELKLRLKDMLEDEVDEKYFLSDKMIEYIIATDYKQPKQILIREATKKGYAVAEEGDGVYLNRPYQKRGVVQKGMIQTIKCNGNDLGVVVADAELSDIGSDIIDIFKEGQVADISFPNGYNKGPRVHDECPTLNGTTTKSSFVVKGKDKVSNEIPLYTNYKKLVETVEKNEMPVDEVKHMDLYNRNLTDNCGTLSDPCHNNNRLWDGLRIRKLTPKECFRLMGFEDKDIECLIENKISNTQLYKMAGNSIVVDVLKYIFVELFKVINIHYKEI